MHCGLWNMRRWSNLFWNRYICWETLSAIHRTKFPENWIKWNGNFRKGRFENFGQPLEVVLFPGNVEIPERFCAIWHSISNFGQTLGPSPSRECRAKMAGSSLYRYQCNICFIFGCFSVFWRHLYVDDNGNTVPPDAPIGKPKQSGTTWTVSVLKCIHFKFFAHGRENCTSRHKFGYLKNLVVSSWTHFPWSCFSVIYYQLYRNPCHLELFFVSLRSSR